MPARNTGRPAGRRARPRGSAPGSGPPGDPGERIRSRNGRRRRRLGAGAFRALENDLGVTNLDLVTNVQLALVDAGAVHHRAGLVTQIDQRDVLGAGNFDDRVHARGQLVIDTQVALRILADFDDVLGNRLTPGELVGLVERER